jgi:acetylornithine deacetylase/succinyl-diaminopimelate desuccinylase-like protein
LAAIAVSLCIGVGEVSAQPHVARLLANPSVKTLLDAARAREPRTIEEQIRICEVPAPPFAETARGDVLRRRFSEAGLQNVRVDAVGNVLGERKGRSPRPHLVVAAHLDTVFPEGTDVRVKRDGPVLRGPGISDNCRGLAVLAAVAELLAGAGVPTDGSVTFVANVGEEGLGDLRGMKALFGETLKGQIDRFVSIDGAGGSITYVSVGSHRYRVRFLGPGGHSFGSFGLANPAHALGRAIARIAELKVPDAPRTTFNVGRIGGGTSVNSIPFEAWMEVDLRSSDPAALASLDEAFQRAMDQAATDENQRWGRPGVVTVAKELVGDRPAGMTPLNSPIVRIARDSARAVGVNAVLSEGSTDANVPMSLAIPAITIDGGGNGSGAHALNETFDTTNSWRGTQNALVVTLALLQAD